MTDLFENETIITSTGDVVLTTHRIRYQQSDLLISFMLDNICSIEVKHRSNPIWILLALGFGIGAIAAFFNHENPGALGMVIAACVCALFYIFTRNHQIRISSAAASIDFQTGELKKEAVRSFIHQIEGARKKLLRL